MLNGKYKRYSLFLSNSTILYDISMGRLSNSLAEALRMSLPNIISKRFKELKEFVEHEVNKYIESINYLLEEMSKESYKKYCILSRSRPSLDWYNLITSKKYN